MEFLRRKRGREVYCIQCSGRTYVLKWFADPDAAVEVRSYCLLAECGVPTLPVYGHSDNALLLEDLTTSARWRVAREYDVREPDTGEAVAGWYRALHAAGWDLLATPGKVPSFLGRETDSLTPHTVLEIADSIGRSSDKIWRLAAESIDAVKRGMQSLRETLNYNDFHWTNLALSRQQPPLRAVVYDYHLLGIGLAYSDCRNVASCLGEKARAAFCEAYGAIDDREAALDAPVSVLVVLREALRLPRFPAWADESLRVARSGEFERSLRWALEVLQGNSAIRRAGEIE